MLIFPKGESRFLRVGWSAWELKIDPKRLRKKIKTTSKKRITKRGEKKSIKNDKKSSNKLCHRLTRQQLKGSRAVWSAAAPRSAPLRAVR